VIESLKLLIAAIEPPVAATSAHRTSP